jgi:uncharacterized membrane protein
MYKKSIAITAVLAALLSVVAISTPMAFADESETETEQELKQKNVGSGDSVNENCGQNLIDSDSTQVCGIFTLSD